MTHFQRQYVTLALKALISLQHGHAGHKPETSRAPKHRNSSVLRELFTKRRWVRAEARNRVHLVILRHSTAETTPVMPQSADIGNQRHPRVLK